MVVSAPGSAAVQVPTGRYHGHRSFVRATRVRDPGFRHRTHLLYTTSQGMFLFSSLLNRHYSLERFQVHSEIEQIGQQFSESPCLHTRAAAAVVNVTTRVF